MGALDDLDQPCRNVGRRLQFGHLEYIAALLLCFRLWALDRKLDDAMAETLVCGNLALQFFLVLYGCDGEIDAKHLMVARDHFPRRPRLALVEQYEILDEIKEPVMRQHPVQEHFSLNASLVSLVEALPFVEMLPFAR